MRPRPPLRAALDAVPAGVDDAIQNAVYRVRRKTSQPTKRLPQ